MRTFAMCAPTRPEATANAMSPPRSPAPSAGNLVTRPRDGMKFFVILCRATGGRAHAFRHHLVLPAQFTSQAEYDRSKQGTNINQFRPYRPRLATATNICRRAMPSSNRQPHHGRDRAHERQYTQDLVERLDVFLDSVVDAGCVDRDRMGLGGQSYGSFRTFNAMTRVPYFKAGIAGDGMYNSPLTPFGFHSERRSFFDAQDMYVDMSAFFRAPKLSGALLLYHSLEDQNVGTAPISSIRMCMPCRAWARRPPCTCIHMRITASRRMRRTWINGRGGSPGSTCMSRMPGRNSGRWCPERAFDAHFTGSARRTHYLDVEAVASVGLERTARTGSSAPHPDQ